MKYKIYTVHAMPQNPALTEEEFKEHLNYGLSYWKNVRFHSVFKEESLNRYYFIYEEVE